MLTTFLSMACLLAAHVPGPSALGSHTWVIHELYSNASGTIQFVELKETGGSPDEIHLGGKSVTALATGMSFTFPADLPPGSSANKHILLGTAALAALLGAPPLDHIIPQGFFAVNGDTLQFHIYATSVLSFGAGQLPLDGACSLSQSLVTGLNSPRNFAGINGYVDLSTPVSATVYDGTTPGSTINPDRLAATPVHLAGIWSATVTPQANRTGSILAAAVILVQTGGAPGSTVILDLAPFTIGSGSAPPSQLLVTGQLLTFGVTSLNGPGNPSNPFQALVPPNCSLMSLPWFSRAIVLGDVTTIDPPGDLDPMFTNGVTGLVGTN